MRRLLCVAVLCGGVAACSGDAMRSPEQELADAQAEADEASAADFSGPARRVCELLSAAELEVAIGPPSGAPSSPPEDVDDTADARCVWHGSDERALSIAESGEGGAERLEAIQPFTRPDVAGSWDAARVQGCCLLHAVRDEALLSLDFSGARIDLAQAARLMDLALSRVHEPLVSDEAP